jgi:hypothetical protein
MGVRIIYDQQHQIGTMYDSTTGTAFGPVFDSVNARQEIEDFCEWLRDNAAELAVGSHVESDGTDPRHYRPGDLEEMVNHWRSLQTYVGDA